MADPIYYGQFGAVTSGSATSGWTASGIAYSGVVPDGAIACTLAEYQAMGPYSSATSGVIAVGTAPGPTLEQQAQTLLAGGLAVTCASDSALDDTYAVTTTMQGYIDAQIESLAQNGTFTNGSATREWPNLAGTAQHSFTVAQFKEFATVVGAFVDGVMEAVLTSGTLPAATATIA